MIPYRLVETKFVEVDLHDDEVPIGYQHLKTHLYLTEAELKQRIQKGPGVVFINGQPTWQAQQLNWREIHAIQIKHVATEAQELMRNPPKDWLDPQFEISVPQNGCRKTSMFSKRDIVEHLIHDNNWVFVDGQMVAASAIADTDLSQATEIRLTRPLVGGTGDASVQIYTQDFFTTVPRFFLFEFLEHYEMTPADFTIFWQGKQTPFELLFKKVDDTYKLRSNIGRLYDVWEDFSMVFQHNKLKWSSKVDGACRNL